MPFVGRAKPPKAKRKGCLTPRWTFLIPRDTLWECRKCNTTYRLSKEEPMAHSLVVEWVPHSRSTKPPCA